jgi:signal transduction histidine kinase
VSNQLPEVGSALLASFLEANCVAVIDAYERRLRAARNPVADEPTSLHQARRVAEGIIADVADSLRAGKVQVDERYRLLAQEVGVARAARRIHPNHSVLAASVFFSEVLSMVSGALGVDPEGNSVALLALVANALEQSIILRIRQSLSSYTGHLLNDVHEAQIGEHRRIARELHDRVGPGMSISHRQLELYHLYKGDNPERASSKVKTAQQAIRESMDELRSITSGLHGRMHVKSLEQAILNFLDTIDSDVTTVRLRVNGNESWAEPDVLDEVFLIIREAARNVFQHASASLLLINVDITPHELNALIEDDGHGFDQDLPPASGGVGVRSMHERAKLLNGRLSISSSVGGGTQVDFALPLSGASPR